MPISADKIAIMEGFANRFTALSRQYDSGLSQKELGGVFSVSSTAIFKWKNGQAMPDIANASLIAKRYKVSVDWLLTGRKPATDIGDSYRELALIIDEMSPENFNRVLETAKAFLALEKQIPTE